MLLVLYENLLLGFVPDLTGLSNLEYLDLGINYLQGSVKSQLENLSLLQYLFLESNFLEGNLAPLTNLEFLCLYINDLSGTIPTELGLLTKLEARSFLQPAERHSAVRAGQFEYVENLYLQDNLLSGSIRDELGDLENLGK